MAGSRQIFLDELELENIAQGYGKAQACKAVSENPLKIAGTEYERGIGTHSHAEILIDLKGAMTSFHSLVGIDDHAQPPKGTVIIEAFVDGELKFRSDILRSGAEPVAIDLDLVGAHQMILMILDAGDCIELDHADFVDAYFEAPEGSSETPAIVAVEHREPKIAAINREELGINCPKVVGASPWQDFLFRLPISGKRPIKISIENLPEGLKLDQEKGWLTGRVMYEGPHPMKIIAENESGRVEREVVIEAEKGKLALTPPMGWNSWNCWGEHVDAERVYQAAEAMISTGLADFGYMYINIDDGWQGVRSYDGQIQPNGKFPDMKGLADRVHDLGLRIGLYSSPGLRTCAGYMGSFRHEAQDAETYADWGYDYLKYDYCSYFQVRGQGDDVELDIKPYRVMGEALSLVPRDIVFSICTAGVFKSWHWGTEVGGHLWRTTVDIHDRYGSMIGNGIFQDTIAEFSGPGGWNDPDMLVIGKVGWGPHLRDCELTRAEQVTHMTLWALLSAPLLLGCEIREIDEFTFNVLANPDVLDINQDPLGKSAQMRGKTGFVQIWSKPLADGSVAAGMINHGPVPAKANLDFALVDAPGSCRVYNAWLRADEGVFQRMIEVELGPHESCLYRLTPEG